MSVSAGYGENYNGPFHRNAELAFARGWDGAMSHQLHSPLAATESAGIFADL